MRPDIRSWVVLLARMTGWHPSKRQPLPGNEVLWRACVDLQTMVRVTQAARALNHPVAAPANLLHFARICRQILTFVPQSGRGLFASSVQAVLAWQQQNRPAALLAVPFQDGGNRPDDTRSGIQAAR